MVQKYGIETSGEGTIRGENHQGREPSREGTISTAGGMWAAAKDREEDSHILVSRCNASSTHKRCPMTAGGTTPAIFEQVHDIVS